MGITLLIISYVISTAFKLAQTNISLNAFTSMVSNIVFLLLLLLVIFFSYVFVLCTILIMNSAKRRLKVFTNGSAHLTVTWNFMVPFSLCMQNTSPETFGKSVYKLQSCLLCMLYGVATFMLNTIIYSIRNKDIKAAMKYLLCFKAVYQNIQREM